MPTDGSTVALGLGRTPAESEAQRHSVITASGMLSCLFTCLVRIVERVGAGVPMTSIHCLGALTTSH